MKRRDFIKTVSSILVLPSTLTVAEPSKLSLARQNALDEVGVDETTFTRCYHGCSNPSRFYIVKYQEWWGGSDPYSLEGFCNDCEVHFYEHSRGHSIVESLVKATKSELEYLRSKGPNRFYI